MLATACGTEPASRPALPDPAWTVTGSPADAYRVVGAIGQSLIVTSTQGVRAINLGGVAPLGGADGTTRWTTVDPFAASTWRGTLVPAGGARAMVDGPTPLAFDLANGTVAWTYGTATSGQQSVGSANRLFVATNQLVGATSVAAVDSAGQVRWSVPYDTLCNGFCGLYGLAVSGDTVLAPGAAQGSSSPGRTFLLAFNATTGARLSTFTDIAVPGPNSIIPAPRVFGRLVLLPALFSVVALDRTTGAVAWRTALSATVRIPFAAPLLVGNRLILPRDSSITALDAATGAQLWEARFPLRGTGVAACPSHLVVAGPQSLFALSLATGEWTHGRQGDARLPSYTSIAGDGARVYVSTDVASVVQAVPCP